MEGLKIPSVAVHESSSGYEGWRVAIAAAVGVFVSFASLLIYTFGIFLKPLTEEFGWSREAVSTAFAIAAMTVAACSPVLGYLFDRFEPKRIIVPSLILFGGAFASLSLLTPHLWHLYTIFVVLGIVANGTAQMAYSRAVSSWFQQRRGLALSIVMSGGAVGAMVMPPMAEALIDRHGWRRAALLLGTMVVVIGLPAVMGFIRERPMPRGAGDSRLDGASVWEGLASRVFWITAIVLFFSSIAQNGAITHMAALLTDRQVSAGGAAAALSAMGGASLAGRLITGWLLDRFFAPRVSCGLLVVAAGGTLLLASAHSVATGVAAAILIGLGMGGEADITPYMLSRYFGLRSFSMLYGFTWTAYALAGGLGPVLMGKAFDATGSYETLLMQLAAATLVVAGVTFAIPRYPPATARRWGAVETEPA